MASEPQKPASWKVVVGLALVYVHLGYRINRAPNLGRAESALQLFGVNLVSLVILGVAIWLVYSGVKTLRRKSR